MIGFLTFLQAVACIFLTIVILVQSGRGGGLTEAFASAESIFGAQTSGFLVKATTVLAVLFLGVSLSLAFLSSKKDQSLMSGQMMSGKVLPKKERPEKLNAVKEVPQSEEGKQEIEKPQDNQNVNEAQPQQNPIPPAPTEKAIPEAGPTGAK